MKTEVLMKRDFLGEVIHQKSKSEFFSATDLFRIGNKWRVANGMDFRTLQGYLLPKSHKEFIAELEAKYGKCILSGRGRGNHTWVHPLIFIDIALWLNPELKVEVYDWLFDELLKYRNESGESYRLMCGALFVRANKTDFAKNIAKLADLIRIECGASSWEEATQDQLRLRNRIHENIALLAEILNNNQEAIRLGILQAKKVEAEYQKRKMEIKK